ncbi:hypothetical protein ABBQ38_012470 [Trebouxia sp. C0009 RCD-2024]
MSSTGKEQASLTGAHVQYVKGVAEEAIGSVTGSEAWQKSGQQDKQSAVDDMRAASSDRKEAQEQRAAEGGSWVAKEGAVEAAAGKLSGCAGMQQEGEMKKQGGSS